MKLALLDRDGVIVVNRATNIKKPSDIALIDGAAEGIRILNQAGFTVAICTNQPEVARGVMSARDLDRVHDGLLDMLGQRGAIVDRVFSCLSAAKCPTLKPAGGLLREALTHYGAEGSRTSFVGDQLDDLKAACRARCRPVLVRTGLGSKTLAQGVPQYIGPFTIYDDLLAASMSISGIDASIGTAEAAISRLALGGAPGVTWRT